MFLFCRYILRELLNESICQNDNLEKRIQIQANGDVRQSKMKYAEYR